MSDHEQGCDCPPEGPPSWELSWWDMLGVGTIVVGNLFQVLGAGAQMFAREFCAQANYARAERDRRRAELQQDAARREMAAAYERLVNGGGGEA